MKSLHLHRECATLVLGVQKVANGKSRREFDRFAQPRVEPGELLGRQAVEQIAGR